MQESETPSRGEIERQAIEYIRLNFGNLSDLPQMVVEVVWVTVYRCVEVAMTAEAGGGQNALVKSMLLDGGRLAQDFESSIHRLEFLGAMIPIIRSSQSRADKAADSQLLADVLKWGILDAGSMAETERAIARQAAKADPEYNNILPPEVWP